MFNLGQLEDRLNQDAALRKQFLDDPVGVLRREGVFLSMSQESTLRDSIGKLKMSTGGAGSGDPLGRRTFGFAWFMK